MLMFCTCRSSFQDKEHGTGKRVHNETKKGMWRCTVCKKEQGKK